MAGAARQPPPRRLDETDAREGSPGPADRVRKSAADALLAARAPASAERCPASRARPCARPSGTPGSCGRRCRGRPRPGAAPARPSFIDERWVERAEDDITFSFLPLYGDRAGHYGTAPSQTGHARLFRDGSLIGESDAPDVGFFSVPPEPADYRIELQSIRGGRSQLSTRIDVAWTFRSQHVDGEPAAPPVMAVRYAPALDDLDRAPAGRPFVIPISISRQPGAPAAPLRRLTVEFSFDGGTVWQRALVFRIGDQAVALLHHPDGEGRVSLRAVAADRDGNAVEQTIRDAYRLRPR